MYLTLTDLNNGTGDQSITEVWTRRNGDQVRASALLAIDGRDELVQDVIVLLVLSEADNVNVDLLLLELLGKFDDFFLISINGRSSKRSFNDCFTRAVIILTRQKPQSLSYDSFLVYV